MDEAEQETMGKIAELVFGRVIKQNHAFGDIGMHLRQVQDELRKIRKDTKCISKELGIVRTRQYNEITNKENKVSRVKHISPEELVAIRQARKLTKTQMAELLHVSINKYSQWESGKFLMARNVEKQLLRIKYMKASEFRCFVNENTAAGSCKEKKQESIVPISDNKIAEFIGRKEIQEVCDILNLSHPQLAMNIGVSPRLIDNWIYHGTQTTCDALVKFRELQKKAFLVPERERQKIKTRATPRPYTRDTITQKEIIDLLNSLHWTMRQMASYLSVPDHRVQTWKYGFCRPDIPTTTKLRELQEKIRQKTIPLEYEGAFVSCEEFITLIRKLKWSVHHTGKMLHMADNYVKKLLSKQRNPNLKDSIKIRDLQQRIATNEIVIPEEVPSISCYKVREICVKQKLTQHELGKIMGVMAETVYQWIRGIRTPQQENNIKLWELWRMPSALEPPLLTAEEVYNCRMTLGLSQEKFGALFGITGTPVSSWERGQRRPSLERSNKIRQLCGLPIPNYKVKNLGDI